jgi:hypothetical protein
MLLQCPSPSASKTGGGCPASRRGELSAISSHRTPSLTPRIRPKHPRDAVAADGLYLSRGGVSGGGARFGGAGRSSPPSNSRGSAHRVHSASGVGGHRFQRRYGVGTRPPVARCTPPSRRARCTSRTGCTGAPAAPDGTHCNPDGVETILIKIPPLPDSSTERPIRWEQIRAESC